MKIRIQPESTTFIFLSFAPFKSFDCIDIDLFALFFNTTNEHNFQLICLFVKFFCVFGLHHTHYLAQVIPLALSGINYLGPFGLSSIGALRLVSLKLCLDVL